MNSYEKKCWAITTQALPIVLINEPRKVEMSKAHTSISLQHVCVLVYFLDYKPCLITFKYRFPINKSTHIEPPKIRPHEVSRSNLIIYLSHKPQFEWYVVRCGSNNGHHKCTCCTPTCSWSSYVPNCILFYFIFVDCLI